MRGVLHLLGTVTSETVAGKDSQREQMGSKVAFYVFPCW